MDIVNTIIAGLSVAALIFYFRVVWYIPDQSKFNIIQIVQLIAASAFSGVVGYSIGGGERDTWPVMAMVLIIFIGTELAAFFSPNKKQYENTKGKPGQKDTDVESSGKDG